MKSKHADGIINTEEQEVIRTILRYGSSIVCSGEFIKGFTQKHHVYGTVSDHSLNVCIFALGICRQRNRDGISEKDLVQAALCHDLGMLNRNDRYAGAPDAWRSHPEESARVAQAVVPDLSANAVEAIRSHMWPAAGPRPASEEAKILTMADKQASMADMVSIVTGKLYKPELKKRILAEAGISNRVPGSLYGPAAFPQGPGKGSE